MKSVDVWQAGVARGLAAELRGNIARQDYAKWADEVLPLLDALAAHEVFSEHWHEYAATAAALETRAELAEQAYVCAAEERDYFKARLSSLPPPVEGPFPASKEHYAQWWRFASRRCDDLEAQCRAKDERIHNQRKEITRLEGTAAEYDAWIRFHDAGNGNFTDFMRKLRRASPEVFP